MHAISLSNLVEQQLAAAREASAGRAAQTLHGGSTSTLRQTLLALVAGSELAEHASPGDATLQVLRGTVRLRADDETWDGETGDLMPIPPQRHSLRALTDAVVLLTVSAVAVQTPSRRPNGSSG
jgi:quercetin dioxygenase-like cupin family protein